MPLNPNHPVSPAMLMVQGLWHLSWSLSGSLQVHRLKCTGRRRWCSQHSLLEPSCALASRGCFTPSTATLRKLDASSASESRNKLHSKNVVVLGRCYGPQEIEKVNCIVIVLILLLLRQSIVPSVLWRCWLGGRKGIQPVKIRVVGYWHGYLSGARCRLAYGPADATATHCLLLQ